MVKKKTDVQFILPEPDELEMELGPAVDEYLEAPYTSILMSTASGNGCVRGRQRNNLALDALG